MNGHRLHWDGAPWHPVRIPHLYPYRHLWTLTSSAYQMPDCVFGTNMSAIRSSILATSTSNVESPTVLSCQQWELLVGIEASSLVFLTPERTTTKPLLFYSSYRIRNFDFLRGGLARERVCAHPTCFQNNAGGGLLLLALQRGRSFQVDEP